MTASTGTPAAPYRAECLPAILGFLGRIGLPATVAPVGEAPFLPGLRIERGRLVVEPERLTAAGDLLHEAGHLACAPAAVRDRLDHDVKASLESLRAGAPAGPIAEIADADRPLACLLQGDEPMAIAWSAAALVALELPVDAVFYPGSYGAPTGQVPAMILQQLQMGMFPGIHWLAQAGMTDAPAVFADEAVPEVPWPRMRRWVQG
jgi:hypothetical protein